ncbi:TetR/AcrR family transcriptional regulator [Streptomyces sp. N2-109]|uniref:TetR/AcrR family transcriptional regulator n=1 Tax=Streptomyces gossypii TaxID=2883101 RepID=A0ABT2JW39_9ACTN|nr:TetR/AcrR family transcriptional regulator [Streptomyces gossypii]MCT2592110.1 TetR/AcrR family transcriptional regulator [Streptomyces gossypii]
MKAAVVGTKTGKRVPRAVREQQMLDAAVAGFARHGYSAASMDDIAEAAGVSKPLVYQYLKSKEDLFTACIERESAALIAAVRAGTLSGGGAVPADRMLWNGLCAFFAHTAAHPDGWAVLHQQARSQGQPFADGVALLRAEIAELVTELIGVAARDAGCDGVLAEREVSGLAHALVGAAESLADWANTREQDPPSAKETAATLMNFCWAGLENLLGGDRWTPAH